MATWLECDFWLSACSAVPRCRAGSRQTARQCTRVVAWVVVGCVCPTTDLPSSADLLSCHAAVVRFLLPLLLFPLASALDVPLRAPLVTLAEFPSAQLPGQVEIVLTIPADAPPDLGAGFYLADRDGRWFQRPLADGLRPGRHRFRTVVAADAPLAAAPPPADWALFRRPGRAGVCLWSAQPSTARIGIDLRWHPQASATSAPILVGMVPGPTQMAVGQMYEVAFRPEPLPVDPYGDALDVALRITEPSGALREVAGFLREPMRSQDRGDREDMLASGPLQYAVRFRPRVPGTHRLELAARWADGRTARCILPAVEAHGPPATGIVRVDASDPRFFSVDGAFWWPIGLNLHNPYDLRSHDVNQTRLTPARGTLTYTAILDRLAAAGGDAAEVWLSSWNLALAWRSDWQGFQGLHGLNLANAEHLDVILDHAWSRGMRLKLVINNHGQASPRTDSEWKDNPLNVAHGGPCARPEEVFTHPAALAFQERLRHYIAARWGDHPAVWSWKLWSEVDLTAGTGEPLRLWHEQAAARWHALDPSGRPVTTHWAGDYHRVDPAICALSGIDYLCLDAYRRARRDRDSTPLAEILAGSIHDPARGLSRFGKPVMVTEFGAGSGVSPEDFRAVDHQIGAWIGLVSGHAAAPMLWWWEWVDQGERWRPYGAVRRFLAGEDLRGPAAQSLVIEARAPAQRLWSRAWVAPGRMFGYVLESGWGAHGGTAPEIAAAELRLAGGLDPGVLQVEWWDPDRGIVLATGGTQTHPGGSLMLRPPPFSGHLAWKLRYR